MNCIGTSLFDIFKIGPGPSSSHTIGPMRAAADFLERIRALSAENQEAAHHIEVELFGSLALTGKGHGSDRAVAAGLLGERPETCDTERLAALLSDPEHKAMELYGAYGEKVLYGKKTMGVIRSTFLIGEDGTVLKVWKKVNTATHGDDVRKYLKEHEL